MRQIVGIWMLFLIVFSGSKMIQAKQLEQYKMKSYVSTQTNYESMQHRHTHYAINHIQNNKVHYEDTQKDSVPPPPIQGSKAYKMLGGVICTMLIVAGAGYMSGKEWDKKTKLKK